MTPTQEAAFRAGSGVGPDALLLAIASTVIMGALSWAAWVSFGSFRAWRLGDIEIYDFLWQVMRACIVLLILGFYIR